MVGRHRRMPGVAHAAAPTQVPVPAQRRPRLGGMAGRWESVQEAYAQALAEWPERGQPVSMAQHR